MLHPRLLLVCFASKYSEVVNIYEYYHVIIIQRVSFKVKFLTSFIKDKRNVLYTIRVYFLYIAHHVTNKFSSLVLCIILINIHIRTFTTAKKFSSTTFIILPRLLYRLCLLSIARVSQRCIVLYSIHNP